MKCSTTAAGTFIITLQILRNLHMRTLSQSVSQGEKVSILGPFIIYEENEVLWMWPKIFFWKNGKLNVIDVIGSNFEEKTAQNI